MRTLTHFFFLSAVEAERVFAVLSALMALCTAALCLVFALCWTPQTVRSYSNTRSLLMAGQALYPTTLLLLAMFSTGKTASLFQLFLTLIDLYIKNMMFFVFYRIKTVSQAHLTQHPQLAIIWHSISLYEQCLT